MKHIKLFESDDLREKILAVIMSDWCKHEDDYPYAEQTADSIMNIINGQDEKS